jgi:hypothetical protein
VPIAAAEPTASSFTIHLSPADARAGDLLQACAFRGRIGRVLIAGSETGEPENGNREPAAGNLTPAERAARTLARFAALLGWGFLDSPSLEVTGCDDVTTTDRSAARRIGGAIRPIVFAERDLDGLRAFAGPAFVPDSEPLASLDEALSGIRVDVQDCHSIAAPCGAPAILEAPRTPWLVRITFPGLVPSDATVCHLASSAGLRAGRVEGAAFSTTARWLLVDVHSRGEIEAAAARLAHAHRLTVVPFRRLQ